MNILQASGGSPVKLGHTKKIFSWIWVLHIDTYPYLLCHRKDHWDKCLSHALEPIQSHFFKNIVLQINHQFFFHRFILPLFTISFSSENKCIYLISPILKHSPLALCTLITITPLFHSQTSWKGCYRLALSTSLLSNSEIFLSQSLELELCTCYQILNCLRKYM